MIPFSLLFLGLSSLIGCLGALMVGHLVPAVSALSLMSAFGLAAYLAKSFRLQLRQPPISIPVFLLYAVVGIGIYFHSVFLFYEKGGNYWIQDQFNIGDMSVHWSAIRFIARGADFWPENPLYLGYRFRYPFGMDFFNALFENLGFALSSHLPLVTLLALLVGFVTLHQAGGPLLVFAVFFSCGLYNIFDPNLNWEHYQLQSSLDFKNLFLTVLLTQRGFLYALPAGVFLFAAYQKYLAGAWKPDLREKITLGIIWGALGFFHLHTYFFISIFLGILILWKKDLKNWLWTIGMASLLGFPFVVNALLPEPGTNSLIHWSARGWARPEDRGYFAYWAQNLGPWIVAVLAAIVVFIRQKKWTSAVPLALAFLLFVLFSHLILAPWNWDNIKLLVWCYLFAVMGLTDLLWNQRQWMVRTVVVLVFLPGFLVFVRALPVSTHGIQWTSEKDLNKAAVLLKGLDINAGIVVTPSYHHPVFLLGHKVLMGYPGHVWSHGYDYYGRENLINRIYAGEDAAIETLPKDQVKWIYWGPLEKRRENPSLLPKSLSKEGEALDHEMYTLEKK